MRSPSPGTLIIDFDGTVVDWLPRHYTCYCSIVEDLGLPRLSMHRYGEIKRRGGSADAMLSECGSLAALELFRARWLERIESPDLLRLDRVLPGVRRRLADWRDECWRLVLLTSRSQPNRLRKQVRRLGLGRLWHRILIAPGGAGGAGKAQRLRQSGLSFHRGCLWIGDSEADLCGARLAGCRFWGVATGVRSTAFLRATGATVVSPSLAAIDLRRRNLAAATSRPVRSVMR